MPGLSAQLLSICTSSQYYVGDFKLAHSFRKQVTAPTSPITMDHYPDHSGLANQNRDSDRSEHLEPPTQSLSPASSPPRTSQLCSICSRVPLQQFLSPKFQRSMDANGDRVDTLTWDLATLLGGGVGRQDQTDPNCNDHHKSETVAIDCVFCTYLSKVLAVSSTSSSFPLDFSKGSASGGQNDRGDYLMIDGSEVRSGRIIGYKGFLGNENRYLREVLCLVIHKDLEPETTFSHTIHLVADGDGIKNKLNEDDVFKVRRMGRRVDAGLLRHWLRRCEGEHVRGSEHDCNQKISRKDSTTDDISGPLRIFLIDVERRCLAPALSTARYIALSYVWGDVEQLRLTSESLERLITPGAISLVDKGYGAGTEAGPTIPRTIRDAIRLCQMLEERYLWVDSLCIVQDDTIHKAEQLSRMGSIYNSAAMTIVAAHGSDAKAPLPGVSSDRDLEAMGILELDLEALGPDDSAEKVSVASRDANWISGVVQTSAWYTRAWTLQEMLLSRRLLVFTPSGHVLFRCRSRTWLEDLILDDVVNDAQISHSHLFPAGSFLDDWDKCDLYTDNHLDRYDRSRSWSETYTYPIEILLTRTLSYDEDILNAASGILLGLEHRLGECFWGVPKRYFGPSLLWTQSQISYPDRRPGFPSWSWAGWKFNAQETITFPSGYRSLWLTLTFSQNHRRLVIFYHYDPKTDRFVSFQTHALLDSYLYQPDHPPYQTPRSYLDYTPYTYPGPEGHAPEYSLSRGFDPLEFSWVETTCSAEIEMQLRAALVAIRSLRTLPDAPLLDMSQLVFFWTDHARFEVELTMQDPTDVLGRKGSYRVFATDSENNRTNLGSLHLDPDWRATRGTKLDFIALTLDGGKNPNHFEVRSRRQMDVFAMVVDWGGPSSKADQPDDSPYPGQVAYRVAVLEDSIPADIWARQGPEQRLVVLG
ncbi:Heterokaryon incompatibility protein (HET) domain containing protein [Rhypophila sp. PSN 637]